MGHPLNYSTILGSMHTQAQGCILQSFISFKAVRR